MLIDKIHRNREKSLGLLELIAIALGGMVGGGIFTILGISVSMIGAYTPIAIILGGVISSFAAYSYIKLGVYYKDEGATYSFFKMTFPNSNFAISLIGWWVIFGYISTLALYSYTFSSYFISNFSFANDNFIRKMIAGVVIFIFTIINIWSVKGMGKIEDLMVYTKLVILVIISFVLINNSSTTIPILLENSADVKFSSILIVSSITFVAYEGFQLVINAVNEMENPEKNIPYAIYWAISLAILIYVIISLGAILAISFDDIIANKEYALASGANKVLGAWGNKLVIIGALLATSSAISGTIFGASRQMSIIAKDGFFPSFLGKRNLLNIPTYSIIAMSILAFSLVLTGSLKLILEFGSVTFLFISLLMAYSNFKIRDKTNSSLIISLISILLLFVSTLTIIYYEYTSEPMQLLFIIVMYTILTFLSWIYSKKKIVE
jgi:amino acid transporter